MALPSRPLRIGLFVDTYTPHINGVVTSVRTLEQELRRQGHEVYIFTVKVKAEPQWQDNVFRLPSISFPFYPDHRIGLCCSRQGMQLLRQLNLDIIHTHTEFSLGLFGRIAAYKLKVPLVHTYHTMYEDYTHYLTLGIADGAARKLARLFSRLYCRNCQAVIAPSPKTRQALESYGVTTNIHVIPTGIPLERFRPQNRDPQRLQQLRQQLHIQPQQPVIVYVGRLAKEKSIDVLLYQFQRLLQHMPEALCLIVGGGPEEASIRNLAQELRLGDRIRFAGEQDYKDIPLYYGLGHIFVSASTTETQGLTYIEAMAAGLPVVAKYDTNLEGIVQNGYNGQFFYHNAELPACLHPMLQDSAYYEQLARQAQQTAEALSASRFGERVAEVYAQYAP